MYGTQSLTFEFNLYVIPDYKKVKIAVWLPQKLEGRRPLGPKVGGASAPAAPAVPGPMILPKLIICVSVYHTI